MSVKRAVQAVAAVGFVVACYALHVETEMASAKASEGMIEYEPGCNGIFGGNCGKVFTSQYGHILSHWGLLPKGHAADLSLAQSGIMLYTLYFVAISDPVTGVLASMGIRERLFLAVAVTGAAFSVYLLYVIKVVLKEFCIVCFTFHCCNFTMLGLAFVEWNISGSNEKSNKVA